ncbi:MAG TPA: hypothetical protein VN648_18280, partial [Candidatus Methylomirabilis sp.]|nr:hypothetical protein [Candidatus Methylomirabilis sp.]
MPIFEKINAGLLPVLEAAGLSVRNRFFEYLDLARNPDPEYRKKLAELIRVRYSARKIDVIVTVYPEALRFVLNEGQHIFPKAPILALLLPLGFQVPTTGRVIIPHTIHASYDLIGTLESALKLIPSATRVFAVFGSHENDRALENRARREFKPWEGRLEFRYLSSMPLEKILATVSTAPPGSIVFFGTFTADVSGRNYASREVVQRLSQISTAPVFGLYDILFGYGIVGGSLVSF